MLHQDGEDPAHAVPLGLVQLRRRAQVRAALLASATHTYASLAAVRGASENATRFAVHKAAERGALLVVPHEGGVLVPAFQTRRRRRACGRSLGAVLSPLLAARMDPWAVWTWLTQPAGLLGGAVPHEAARDPEEPADRAACGGAAGRAGLILLGRGAVSARGRRGRRSAGRSRRTARPPRRG
ncbi:hypothetical protein G5V59_17385 [Nocardioides sp. W3-2-3]|uniref:hypothetical protein n=1 Tax=Nocardioides convexus TaxID=2712224 RepID=UPI00241876D3|nr:hypothetical protein [Nocardioides convexus]NHA01061.1 hypothetical protein [Nocardioides convexus]